MPESKKLSKPPSFRSRFVFTKKSPSMAGIARINALVLQLRNPPLDEQREVAHGKINYTKEAAELYKCLQPIFPREVLLHLKSLL